MSCSIFSTGSLIPKVKVTSFTFTRRALKKFHSGLLAVTTSTKCSKLGVAKFFEDVTSILDVRVCKSTASNFSSSRAVSSNRLLFRLTRSSTSATNMNSPARLAFKVRVRCERRVDSRCEDRTTRATKPPSVISDASTVVSSTDGKVVVKKGESSDTTQVLVSK